MPHTLNRLLPAAEQARGAYIAVKTPITYESHALIGTNQNAALCLS